MDDLNPNRISPDGGPVLSSPAKAPAPHVADVPLGVKVALAAAIPGLASCAAMLPPPWNLVCAIVGASVAGIAGFLGMATGSQRIGKEG